jgi:hypothetical protein
MILICPICHKPLVEARMRIVFECEEHGEFTICEINKAERERSGKK